MKLSATKKRALAFVLATVLLSAALIVHSLAVIYGSLDSLNDALGAGKKPIIPLPALLK